MNNIEQTSKIDRCKLNNEFYFQSLLEEAYCLQMVSDADIEKIQLDCLELLAQNTNRYNSGESSSIRVELAENIMKSNLYTISIALKAYQTADEAVKALLCTKLSDLYQTGKKIIYEKIKSAKQLFTITLETKLNTENYTYNSTIVDGIKGFFKIYNPEYESYEIHITADYPLYNPIENLAGIEFIEEYIKSVYLENMFCKYFSETDIHYMLCGYDKNYKELIFNIFEQTLTCSLGRIIAGFNADSVLISNSVIEKLNILFSGKSEKQIELILEKATKDLFMKLNISDESLKSYMQKGLPQIKSIICTSVKYNMLNNVFPKPLYPEPDNKIIVSFGEKMKDEKYRELLDEIISCKNEKAKTANIMQDIKSLGDLEDILIDSNLNKNEILIILEKLTPYELAAFAKRHPFKPEIDFDDTSSAEQTLRLSIYNFIQKQSENYKNKFKAIMSQIKII